MRTKKVFTFFFLLVIAIIVILVAWYAMNSNEYFVSEKSAGECITQGCSGTICVDEDEFEKKPYATNCRYLPVYACYKDTVCERQSDGECGWTETEEFSACLDENKEL